MGKYSLIVISVFVVVFGIFKINRVGGKSAGSLFDRRWGWRRC